MTRSAHPTRRAPARAAVRLLLSIAVLALAACSSSGSGGGGGSGEAAAPVLGGDRVVRASDLSREEMQEFQTSWRMFVTHDPMWSGARDRWLEKGGAATYVLSENLFRYFWSASRVGRRDEVLRVAREAALVGEPAVAYYVKALVTDRWPLQEPVTVEVFNPDDIGRPLKKTFTHYDMDDTTRQHAAQVLAAIGAPAVDHLAAPRVLGAALPSSRRYALYALGAIGTDAAVAVLGRVVRTAGEWQDRGAAAKALGFALPRNPTARPHLEAAARDTDDFVRRKATEGLEGRTRIEF